MRKPRAGLYDYLFILVGLVFTYGFLAFGEARGWSTSTRIIALVALSIPAGLALGWFKAHLEQRRRKRP